MISKKKALTAVLATSVLCSAATFLIARKNTSPNQTSNVNASSGECSYNIKRLLGYEYIKPLEYAEPMSESALYAQLKTKIETLVAEKKKSGVLNNASVYLRDFNKGNWMSFQGKVPFHPGSLIKVPILISYLKFEEHQPGILNAPVTFTGAEYIPSQSYNSKQIEVGKTYTIRELLDYMIKYSDNNATFLLKKNLNVAQFKKTYDNVGLPVPNIMDVNYSLSAEDFSVFLKVLFNAGYLSIENSEYAIKLLTGCDFKEGFLKGLPAGTPVAHKFGEWGDGGVQHELHESGIIYLNGDAYILTVMTSGKNIQDLTKTIQEITQVFYQEIDDPNVPNTLFQKKNIVL
jgi:beta-lactamase class A